MPPATAPTAAAARGAIAEALRGSGEDRPLRVAAAFLAAASGCRGAPDWEALDAQAETALGAAVDALLRLPLARGAADPALAAVREEVFARYDDLRWWATEAACNTVDRVKQMQQQQEEEGGKRGKREAAAGGPVDVVAANCIALLYGVPIPRKDPSGDAPELELFLDEQLRRMRADRERFNASSAGLSSKQRYKQQKRGVLQIFSCACHQSQCEKLWLGLLELPLPRARLLALLDGMDSVLMPYLPHPLMLFDFLCEAYAEGGMVGILALNSLFVLMIKHGLEYPAFFDRLYGLLTPDVCYLRHRERFFDLTAQFLTSVGLGAAVVAAFIKRAVRISLHAPTPAVSFLVPFVRQLMLRHPETMVLIHRGAGDEAAAVWRGKDPFDDNAEDPAKSRALESCAWELCALQQHANPVVAAAAKRLSEEIKQGVGELEALRRFSSRSFAKLFAREANRPIKRVPSAAYADPLPFAQPRDAKRRRVAAPAAVCALGECFRL